ncbi:MAG TPA: RecX family transcriptional regulator [Anaerolineales bacterium]
MARITALEPQKRDPGRVNVHLDGEYAFSLARIVAAWLQIGQDLSAEKTAALQIEDAKERAYQQAMLFLSYRIRSTAEIRQNLRKHEIPADIIEETIRRLQAERLASDDQFAKAWVENRSTFRPRSRRALTMELRRKGVPDETVNSALKDVDEDALAYQAASRRARRLASLDWNDYRTKLSEFLARRGFAYSVVAPVVSRVWTETHAPHDDSWNDNSRNEDIA